MRTRGWEIVRDSMSLRDLCDSLNCIYDIRRPYFPAGTEVEKIIDIDSIPVFSNKKPTNTEGVYSWDDEWVIRFDDYGFYMDYRDLDYPKEVAWR